MRHFRDIKEIEQFMIDEFLRQGIPVICGGGSCVVAITDNQESGAAEVTEFDVTQAAAQIWEALS